MTNEKIKNTLMLLANGFSKLNSSALSSFNYVRGAASSLAASAGNKVSAGTSSLTSSPISSLNNNNSNGQRGSNMSMDDSHLNTKSSFGDNMNANNNKRISMNSNGSPSVAANNTTATSTGSSSGSVVNREIRIGVTYAYVELANLLGSQWLEKNLNLYLTQVLCLVNNTKAVSTHLDAVYSRKCVQFILRSIIGGMLNEQVQIQAARELIVIIEKCINGFDLIETGKMKKK